MMKRVYVTMLAGAIAFGTLFAGCGDNTSDAQSSDVENTDADAGAGDAAGSDADTDADADADAGTEADEEEGGSLLDDFSNAMQADGRNYGQTYHISQSDVMESAFFDLKVNSVSAEDSLEGYVPEGEEYTFLIVNVSITNTFGDTIPMSNTDFEILWGGGEQTGEANYPDPSFSSALPGEYNIGAGETETGDLIYIVPKEVRDFTLEYYDLWDDNFEGDTFDMAISLN